MKKFDFNNIKYAFAIPSEFFELKGFEERLNKEKKICLKKYMPLKEKTLKTN